MRTESYFLIMTLIAGTVTIALRAFPFIMFNGSRQIPPVICYLGKVLSPAAIGMLVVYCYCSSYRDLEFCAGGFGLPELLASLLVVALQMWRRNPLLSIVSGTILYMVIRQNFF